MANPWEIRPVTCDGAEQLGALKIEAATAHPTQFVFAPEDVVGAEIAELGAGLDSPGAADRTFGVFVGDRLFGSAEFAQERRSKTSHRGEMKAMYVRPFLRGTGVADELLLSLLGYAAAHVDVVHAAVGVDNLRAKKLYFRHGFRSYGVQPGMIRHEGRDVPGELLLRQFDPGEFINA